jgi:beta-1,4-N-acetylglucosaminyltransferase
MSHKVCFVTIGATAKFDQLVSAVLSKSFLDALGKENYTLIRIQYGKSGPELFNALVSRAEQENGGKLPHGLMVDGFNISDTSFEQLMRIAKPEEGRREGMVVSHAGTCGSGSSNPTSSVC